MIKSNTNEAKLQGERRRAPLGGKDGIRLGLKEFAEIQKTRAKELHVALNILSGKQHLGLGILNSTIVMRQNAEGYIYFDKVAGAYQIVGYEWEGPRYRTVSTAQTVVEDKGKDKSKRKGGLGGAAIGTLLLPGVGTAVGYMMTSKKETKHKGGSQQRAISQERQEEIASNAKLTLRNSQTGEQFVIGFQCTSRLDMELANFNLSAVHQQENARQEKQEWAEAVTQQKSNVELLKEYKELLDAGVITQDEFETKKKQLLEL